MFVIVEHSIQHRWNEREENKRWENSIWSQAKRIIRYFEHVAIFLSASRFSVLERWCSFFLCSRNLDKLNKNDNEMNNGEVKRTRKYIACSTSEYNVRHAQRRTRWRTQPRRTKTWLERKINENAYQERSRMVNTWNKRFSSIKCVALFIESKTCLVFIVPLQKRKKVYALLHFVPDFYEPNYDNSTENSITQMKYLIASHFCTPDHTFYAVLFFTYLLDLLMNIFWLFILIKTPEIEINVSHFESWNGQEKLWNVLIKTACNISKWKWNSFQGAITWKGVSKCGAV